MIDRRLKKGFTSSSRLDKRLREHGCASGEFLLLWAVSKADKKFESMIFERFKDYRLQRRTRGKPYEIFRPAPEVLAWYRSEEAERLGFMAINRPIPTNDTCVSWCLRCEAWGVKAARTALNAEKRLRELVPRSARGGWVMWESISGRISPQLCLNVDGLADEGTTADELNGWPIHILRYRNHEFRFPVFAEACERQGIKPPKLAIRTGVAIFGHRTASGRRGIPLRKRVVVPVREELPGQSTIFDFLAKQEAGK